MYMFRQRSQKKLLDEERSVGSQSTSDNLQEQPVYFSKQELSALNLGNSSNNYYSNHPLRVFDDGESTVTSPTSTCVQSVGDAPTVVAEPSVANHLLPLDLEEKENGAKSARVVVETKGPAQHLQIHPSSCISPLSMTSALNTPSSRRTSVDSVPPETKKGDILHTVPEQSTVSKTVSLSMKLEHDRWKRTTASRQSIGHMAIQQQNDEDDDDDDDENSTRKNNKIHESFSSDVPDDQSTGSSVLTSVTEYTAITGPMMLLKQPTPNTDETGPKQLVQPSSVTNKQETIQEGEEESDSSFAWAYAVWRKKGLFDNRNKVNYTSEEPKAARKLRYSMPGSSTPLRSDGPKVEDEALSPRKKRMSMQPTIKKNSHADAGFENVLKQWKHVSHEQPKTDYLIPSNATTSTKATVASLPRKDAVRKFRDKIKRSGSMRTVKEESLFPKKDAPNDIASQAAKIKEKCNQLLAKCDDNHSPKPDHRVRRESLGESTAQPPEKDTSSSVSVRTESNKSAALPRNHQYTSSVMHAEPILLSPQKKRQILGDTPIQRKPVNLTPPRAKPVKVHKVEIAVSPVPAKKSEADDFKSASPWTRQLLSKIQANQDVEDDSVTPRNEARKEEHPWTKDTFVRNVPTYDPPRVGGTCQCSNSIFSGDKDVAEFFLPLMGLACTCGKNSEANVPKRVLINADEPTSLENILRPWQVDFLANFGIHRGDQLVKAHHRSAGALAKSLRQYRRKNGMAPFRTKSCGMALHIWSKTSKAFVRSIRKQLEEGTGEIKLPNTLYIVSAFLDQMKTAGERIREDEDISPRNNMDIKVE